MTRVLQIQLTILVVYLSELDHFKTCLLLMMATRAGHADKVLNIDFDE